MDAPFTIVSSPAMQAVEAAEERKHLAKTAAADQLLLDDDAGPHWRAVEHAEHVLAHVDADALCTVQDLDKQNDARGREIARLRTRIAELTMTPRERANARVRALLDAGDHEGAAALAEAFEASEAYAVTHPNV